MSTMQRKTRMKEWKVMSPIEMKLANLIKMKTLIGRILPSTTKIRENLCRICPKDRKTMRISQKEILQMKTMHKSLQKEGIILSCAKYRKIVIEMKIWVLEVWDTKSDPNPNYSEDFRY